MIVYRIARTGFSEDLSGKGAQLYGGRWNSKGTAALYASAYRSLSALEMAVHLTGMLHTSSFELITLDIRNIPITDLSRKLPAGWQQSPAPFQTQHLGDIYLSDPGCGGILVPSVLVEEEFNVVLNPGYTHFKQLKIKDKRLFTFDSRLKHP